MASGFDIWDINPDTIRPPVKQAFSFNGYELNYTMFRVTALDYPVLPDLDILSVKTPRTVGRYTTGTEIGEVMQEFEITIIDKDLIKAREELVAFLLTSGFETAPLILKGDSSRFRLGKVSGAPNIQELFTYGKTKISFVCSDPLLYSTEISTIIASSGVAFTAKGTAQVPALLDLTLSNISVVTAIGIYHENTKKLIQFNLPQGQTNFLVDLDRRLVYDKDSRRLNVLPLSRWFQLSAGNNIITIEDQNRKTIGGTINIKSRPAYY